MSSEINKFKRYLADDSGMEVDELREYIEQAANQPTPDSAKGASDDEVQQ